MGITPKQKLMMQFLETYQDENGFAPTQSEIAKHFGFKSLGTVQNYLSRLEREGKLKRPWNAKRGLSLVPIPVRASETRELPLLGKVAAGRPIEAIDVLESIEVPAGMIKRGHDHFVLRVTGDSMVGDGILDGDYVVLRKQATAHDGETVVALVNGEATIKRYYRRKEQVELVASNPAYQPIRVHRGQEFKILGVLSGLIRLHS